MINVDSDVLFFWHVIAADIVLVLDSIHKASLIVYVVP